MENKKYHAVGTVLKSKITSATQSVAYPLAYKFDSMTLTFDLENQQDSRFSYGLSMYQVWSKSTEGC